jgi:iron complex transport system ATP-binding protein
MIGLQHIKAVVRGEILFQADEVFFPKGSLTALLGRNGSGKSTLLKAIAGLESLVYGSVSLEGEIHQFQKNYFPSPLVSYIPVKIEPFGAITLFDFVLSGGAQQRGFMDIPSIDEQNKVLDLLAQFNIKSMAYDAFENLSDGEQKMALILRSIHKNAQILLLDEPESFLDVGNRRTVFRLLKELANQGKTIVFSTHHPDLAANYVNQFLAIHEQKLSLHPVNSYHDLVQLLFEEH